MILSQTRHTHVEDPLVKVSRSFVFLSRFFVTHMSCSVTGDLIQISPLSKPLLHQTWKKRITFGWNLSFWVLLTLYFWVFTVNEMSCHHVKHYGINMRFHKTMSEPDYYCYLCSSRANCGHPLNQTFAFFMSWRTEFRFRSSPNQCRWPEPRPRSPSWPFKETSRCLLMPCLSSYIMINLDTFTCIVFPKNRENWFTCMMQCVFSWWFRNFLTHSSVLVSILKDKDKRRFLKIIITLSLTSCWLFLDHVLISGWIYFDPKCPSVLGAGISIFW